MLRSFEACPGDQSARMSLIRDELTEWIEEAEEAAWQEAKADFFEDFE